MASAVASLWRRAGGSVGLMVGLWLCGRGRHDYRITTMEDWKQTGMHFRCIRCGRALKEWPKKKRENEAEQQ